MWKVSEAQFISFQIVAFVQFRFLGFYVTFSAPLLDWERVVNTSIKHERRLWELLLDSGTLSQWGTNRLISLHWCFGTCCALMHSLGHCPYPPRLCPDVFQKLTWSVAVGVVCHNTLSTEELDQQRPSWSGDLMVADSYRLSVNLQRQLSWGRNVYHNVALIHFTCKPQSVFAPQSFRHCDQRCALSFGARERLLAWSIVSIMSECHSMLRSHLHNRGSVHTHFETYRDQVLCTWDCYSTFTTTIFWQFSPPKTNDAYLYGENRSSFSHQCWRWIRYASKYGIRCNQIRFAHRFIACIPLTRVESLHNSLWEIKANH